MSPAGQTMGAEALLRVVAEGSPQQLLAWAEAHGIQPPVLAALRGGRGAPTWRTVAEQRAAAMYVQAEIVRYALRLMNGESGRSDR